MSRKNRYNNDGFGYHIPTGKQHRHIQEIRHRMMQELMSATDKLAKEPKFSAADFADITLDTERVMAYRSVEIIKDFFDLQATLYPDKYPYDGKYEQMVNALITYFMKQYKMRGLD